MDSHTVTTMSSSGQDKQEKMERPGGAPGELAPDEGALPDPRRFRRVPVKLRVAVVLGRHTAYLAHSTDISEGGLQITGYQGPALARDRLIGVNMRGVVSDSTADDGEQYLVRVVRHEGESLAVRFVEED
jgi:hypothetical protein